MANVITEVTNQSIFGRIGNSVVGALIGILLLIGSVVLLFWNEGRAVATAKSLSEGAATVIDVPSDAINPANDSKLVHVTGDTAVTDPLTDPLFNISEAALRLRRNIEVYQWKEKKESKSRDKVGGGKETVTTYSYEKAWSPDLIRSNSFKSADDHQNPSHLPVPKKEFVANNATLGQFKLSLQIIEKISGDEALEATEARLSKVSDELESKLKIDGDRFYLGGDPANPDIGDERISFSILRPGTISIVAAQTKQSFTPYVTKNEREIELVETGNVSAPQMFAHALAANQCSHVDSACRRFRCDVLWWDAHARPHLGPRAQSAFPGVAGRNRFRDCSGPSFRRRFSAGDWRRLDFLPASFRRGADCGCDRVRHSAQAPSREAHPLSRLTTLTRAATFRVLFLLCRRANVSAVIEFMPIIGTVDSLWRYPVKSMRGEEMDELFAGYAGVYGDRLFAFKTSAGPKGFPYFTGREQRQMIRYRARFRHPDKAARPVNLREAEGNGAAPLSANAEELMIDVEAPDGDVFAIDDPALVDKLRAGQDAKHELTLLRSDRALVDCGPLSLFSIQTARKLAEESGSAVDKRAFRANVYLDLPSLDAFAEDQFVGRNLRIGSKTVITILKRDSRCMMIILDPETAEKAPAILRTVAQAHDGKAGVYAAVLTEGMIRKGDPVEAL